MDDLDLETIDLELRGITDSTHCEYDHLSKISSLVAMAQARARSKPAFARTVAAKRKQQRTWIIGRLMIIVATDEGVTKVRTVRRTPPSQHWQPDIVNGLKALPWNQD